MVLSEREKRLLQEMENRLQAEDPRLASSLSVRRLRIGANTALAVAGLVVGVLLMGIGVVRAHAAGIAMALVGFVILLASTSLFADLLRSRGVRGPFARRAAKKTSGTS